MVGSELISERCKLVIECHLYQQMIAYLRGLLPNEGCGFLAGVGETVIGLYEVDNLHDSPFAFEMDPRQHVEAMFEIEEQGLEMLAIFHSHPQGPGYPSEQDVERSQYPDAASVIVSFVNEQEPTSGAFTIINREVKELELVIEDP